MKQKFCLLLCAFLLVLNSISIADSVYTLAGYDDQTNHDWNNNFALDRVSEATGQTFNYQQYTDAEAWTKAKSDMLKGKDIPDGLFKAALTDDETFALYEAGVIIDLKPYLAEYAPNLTKLLAEHEDWSRAITMPDGAIVALPNINELQNNNVIWINKVWLNKLGLSMPTTAEEFTEVLRAFQTRDPNTNGKNDEIPFTFTGMWDLRYLAHAFGIYSNDYYIQTEGGIVRQTVTTDENRAFLTWCHQLWEEGLIDHSGFSASDTTRRITDSNAAILYGVVMGPSVLQMLPGTEVQNYIPLLPLMYNGNQVYRRTLNQVSRGAFAVTNKCSDPAALVAWADFFYTEEGSYLVQAGKEGYEYERLSDGKWYWVDSPNTLSETILPDYTIADGTLMPLYITLDYQLNYDDEATHAAVASLYEFDQLARDPYPLLNIDRESNKKINKVWIDLATYAETEMARFVTGDIELNDINWNAYCKKVEELGINEIVTIWQNALNQ